MYEIIPYPYRRLFNALEPLMQHGKGVGDVKKSIRLVFCKDFVDSAVNLLPLPEIEGSSSLKQEIIHLVILTGDEIEVSPLCLLRMPYVIKVRVPG